MDNMYKHRETQRERERERSYHIKYLLRDFVSRVVEIRHGDEFQECLLFGSHIILASFSLGYCAGGE
jgi:hypothetical protein